MEIHWEDYDEGISELITEVKTYPNLREETEEGAPQHHQTKAHRASTSMHTLKEKLFSKMTPNFEEPKHSKDTPPLASAASFS